MDGANWRILNLADSVITADKITAGSIVTDPPRLLDEVVIGPPIGVHEGPLVVYDPRDPLQARHNKSTWRPTSNVALIQAHFQRLRFGDGMVDWDRVARLAEHCDEIVDIPF